MKKRTGFLALILMVNILLIGATFLFFFRYSRDSQVKLQEENLHNIRNLNQSAANIASSYFEARREKIADIPAGKDP